MSKERRYLQAIANLGYCNPFLPERVELERAALGSEFVAGGPVWSVSVSDPDRRKTGSFEEAARRLGLDRRTVKKKVTDYLARDARQPSA